MGIVLVIVGAILLLSGPTANFSHEELTSSLGGRLSGLPLALTDRWFLLQYCGNPVIVYLLTFPLHCGSFLNPDEISRCLVTIVFQVTTILSP